MAQQKQTVIVKKTPKTENKTSKEDLLTLIPQKLN